MRAARAEGIAALRIAHKATMLPRSSVNTSLRDSTESTVIRVLLARIATASVRIGGCYRVSGLYLVAGRRNTATIQDARKPLAIPRRTSATAGQNTITNAGADAAPVARRIALQI